MRGANHATIDVHAIERDDGDDVSRSAIQRARVHQDERWYQYYDGGRAFYTALGHLSGAYSDDNFLHHLYGGLYWAATGNGFRAQGSPTVRTKSKAH